MNPFTAPDACTLPTAAQQLRVAEFETTCAEAECCPIPFAPIAER